MDVRLNKEFRWAGLHFDIFSDITNIFDKQNVITVFQTTGNPDQSTVPGISVENQDRPNFYGPQRHIELGLQVEF